MIFLIIAVIISIFLIEYIKGIQNGSEEELKCIASTSILYVSKTCSHCANQKLILGEGIKYFTLIDCSDDIEKCQEADITAVPTWIIDGEKHAGVRTVNELKELSGC